MGIMNRSSKRHLFEDINYQQKGNISETRKMHSKKLCLTRMQDQNRRMRRALESRTICTVISREKGENLKDCTFFLAQSIIFYGF